MKHTSSRLTALFAALLLIQGFPAGAKRKARADGRKWSVSFTNGRTFHNLKEKNSPAVSTDLSGYDGQMNPFFSSLEISRNFGYYEIGGRLQVFDYAFVSPFVKINLRKNHLRARLIPSLIFGVVPSPLLGGYARAGLSWFINPYTSFRPFFGIYSWYRRNPHKHYIKFNLHLNFGLTVTVYL